MGAFLWSAFLGVVFMVSFRVGWTLMGRYFDQKDERAKRNQFMSTVKGDNDADL